LLFVKNCFSSLEEIHNVLTYNKIWKSRLINIGSVSYEDCKNYSLTGVFSRCCGLKNDMRLSKSDTYSWYNQLKIKSFIGVNGDSFDRYLIRLYEMNESLNIINLLSEKFCKKYKDGILYVNTFVNSYLNYSCNSHSNSMEDLIAHFLNWHSGFFVFGNITTSLIESPKGVFGVSIGSDGSEKPSFCKVRSPSYFNLQALNKMLKGGLLADLSTLIGTVDIVFGEIDR
jgi:NADH-quinone oxidoreductase subunit D